MGSTQIGVIEQVTLDKRRVQGDVTSRQVVGGAVFTANGAGTTTTIVGANAAPGTNDNNVIRRGERYKVFASGSATPKEEKVLTVTAVAVGASTTVTFTPALLANTASGDFLKRVGAVGLDSMQAIDDALIATGLACYATQALVDKLTLNDKLYALQTINDPGAR
jgi:hypothetical protein